jgi:hypothetical protein
MTHFEELEPLTKRMINLKKQEAGDKLEPITMERLQECASALQKIGQPELST